MKVLDNFINAAASWVLLKTIELLPIACYDIYAAVARFIEFSRLPDAVEEDFKLDFYDSRRGKLEYVLSGAGFANLRLARESKKWFVISTVVPMLIFTVELQSLYLGFEEKVCKTSSDPSVISAPSLVLFGDGQRMGDLRFDDYFVLNKVREDYETPFWKPCVRRDSEMHGVDFSAKICGETASIPAHVNAAAPALAVPRTNTGTINTRSLLKKRIATMIPTTLRDADFFFIRVYEIKSRESRDDLVELGSMRFSSQVLVGGRNLLIRNATSRGSVSPEKKSRFRSTLRNLDSRLTFSNLRLKNQSFEGGPEYWYWENENTFGYRWNLETYTERGELKEVVSKLRRRNQSFEGRPEYWENEDMFGFHWNLETYMKHGGLLMTYALLAQATNDTIRPAIEMSEMNKGQPHRSRRLSDTLVYCKVLQVLSPRVSVSIIVGLVVFRLLLSLVGGSVSSTEFALVTSEEISNSQQCSVFFMDRRQVVCPLRRSRKRVSSHVGHTSVDVHNHPKRPVVRKQWEPSRSAIVDVSWMRSGAGSSSSNPRKHISAEYSIIRSALLLGSRGSRVTKPWWMYHG